MGLGVTRRAGTPVEESGPLAALDAGVDRIRCKDEASTLGLRCVARAIDVLARVSDRSRMAAMPLRCRSSRARPRAEQGETQSTNKRSTQAVRVAFWLRIRRQNETTYALKAKTILNAAYAAKYWIRENKNEKLPVLKFCKVFWRNVLKCSVLYRARPSLR